MIFSINFLFPLNTLPFPSSFLLFTLFPSISPALLPPLRFLSTNSTHWSSCFSWGPWLYLLYKVFFDYSNWKWPFPFWIHILLPALPCRMQSRHSTIFSAMRQLPRNRYLILLTQLLICNFRVVVYIVNRTKRGRQQIIFSLAFNYIYIWLRSEVECV